MFAILCNDGRGESGQRGQPHNGLLSGQRDSARGRKADAQAGKTAGTGGDGNTVERRESDTGGFHHARDQRHQGFGVAALHRLRFLGDDLARAGVEHGGGAGIKRRIDSEDQHEGEANGGAGMANRVSEPVAIRHSLLAIRLSNSHRPDFDYVGDEMLQQVLDAVL